MPFDFEPSHQGKWQLFMRRGEAMAKYVAEGGAGLRVAHFTTCGAATTPKGAHNDPNLFKADGAYMRSHAKLYGG